jgi:hypothetical protein
MLFFFTENFQVLMEQTNPYYQQQVHKQAEPSHPQPDVMLHNMTTFIALAL